MNACVSGLVVLWLRHVLLSALGCCFAPREVQKSGFGMIQTVGVDLDIAVKCCFSCQK